MSVMLGYQFWGEDSFGDDSTSITSIKRTELSSAIVDEVHVRDRTDIPTSNVKDAWQSDTKLLGTFTNSLEAGNLFNEGVKVTKFKVMRRLESQGQNDDIFMGEINFSGGNADLEFEDVTNPNTKLVYTILSVGENGLEGSPREITVESNFSGIWVVDKDTKEVMVFDKSIGGSELSFESTLNQNRTQIDTFSKYPQIYYGSNTTFETFTLSTVVLPEDGERTGKKYKEILDKFILDHKPKIVKTDTGRIMVCDISNLRVSQPMTTWENADYMQISVDAVEIEDYAEHMKGE